jgi:hypothetical protein
MAGYRARALAVLVIAGVGCNDSPGRREFLERPLRRGSWGFSTGRLPADA